MFRATPLRRRFATALLSVVVGLVSVASLYGSDLDSSYSPLGSPDGILAEANGTVEPIVFPDLKKDADGYWQVGFQHLASFSFGHHRIKEGNPLRSYRRNKLALLRPDESDVVEMPTEPGTSGTIPSAVKALDSKCVCIAGYMLPIKMENGLVRECLLLRNQNMCCYGRRPELNEWVVVKMKGKGVPSTMDTPISFFGTLHVGEIFENHVFEGLYALDCEKVARN